MKLRSALLLAGLAAATVNAAASVAIAASGGWVWRWGSIRVSMRDGSNPAMAAVVLIALVWFAARSHERHAFGQAVRGYGARPERLAVPIVGVAAVAMFLLGTMYGTWVAGGADAYGYVSQADLWAHGELIVHQPFADAPGWPTAPETLAPLGYRVRPASDHRADLSPTYSPGVPMLMGLFEIVGGRSAAFVVVPLLAAVAVCATFILGRAIGGSLLGAAAAVLLATSPSFLFEVTAPTSDVPVTAWWTLALALAIGGGRRRALAAGLATSMAILTRPNLALVAAVPAGLLVWRALRGTSADALRASALFVAGAVPGVATVAMLNAYWYGSPLTSGYGALSAVFSARNIAPNLARYPIWFVQTQTPLALFVLAAPLALLPALSRRWAGTPRRDVFVMLVLFAVTVLTSYLFYMPWQEWQYLRFLLPAYPPVLLLALLGLRAVVSPLERAGARLPALIVAGVVVLAAFVTLRFALDERLLQFWRDDQRYVKAGAYIARTLPPETVVFAMQHSGSARFYSGRTTIRYDLLSSGELDAVVADLQRIGYSPYLLVDDWEEAAFRTQFDGSNRLGRLDWMPVASIARNRVRLYDLAAPQRGQASTRTSPDIVD